MATPALRVAQLDAELLDKTLLRTIRSQLDELAIRLFPSATWQGVYQDCRRLLPAIYYLHRLHTGTLCITCLRWDDRLGRSPGQRMMGMLYEKYDRFRAFCHFLLSILTPVALRLLADRSPNEQLKRWASRAETAVNCLNLANFFYFLSRGGEADLVRRVFGIRSIYERTPTMGKWK